MGELGKGLGVAPSTLSHHVKELNRSGLVRTERSGRNVICWVDAYMVDALRAFFDPITEPGRTLPEHIGETQ